MARPKIAVLYQFLHPDDVVSARHFSDLCEGLAARGWDVEALPSNRSCRDPKVTYAPSERWRGVDIERVWRPQLPQEKAAGRLANAGWMISRWSALAARPPAKRPDVVLVGTDPVLAVSVASVIRRAGIKVAHWAFDLYPEAPIAEGMIAGDGALVRALRPLLRDAYAHCDLIADLGLRMRERIVEYGTDARTVTLVPWALSEPGAVAAPDPATRASLFGENARLTLLYSGNFGRAHSFDELLALARKVRGKGVELCFAVRGNRADELRAAVRTDDTNIHFAGFADESALAKRLAAADIHLASLRPGWDGIVTPSKFFGSLASGRPVLFTGPQTSDLTRWIGDLDVGWATDGTDLDRMADVLIDLAAHPERLPARWEHCQQVYRSKFSRAAVIGQWDDELRDLVGVPRTRSAASAGASAEAE